jgi:hypothetical protein
MCKFLKYFVGALWVCFGGGGSDGAFASTEKDIFLRSEITKPKGTGDFDRYAVSFHIFNSHQ